MICEECGMSYPERLLCRVCAFTARKGDPCMACGGSCDGGPAPEHVCPEPYPRDVAESLLAVYSATGAVVHPREKARIVRALKGTADLT